MCTVVKLPMMLQEDCDVDSIREALVRSAIHHLPKLPRGSLSDVAWASAALDLRDNTFLALLEARAVTDVDWHSCSSICTIVWAFAKLEWSCHAYLSAANQKLAAFLKAPTVMHPRDVALLLWSFAEMKQKPSQKVCTSEAILYVLFRSSCIRQPVPLQVVLFNEIVFML